MEILYKTIHGSRLYGLDHANSDYDWYTVVRNPRKTSHKIAGDQDNTVVDFGTFVRHAQAGAPQALEAMFSTKAEIDHIADFRQSFVAGKDLSTYRGIIKRIAKTEKWDDFKHRRMIIRLSYDAWELQRYGRFNPEVDDRTKDYITSMAETRDMNFCYGLARHMMSLLE